jgi:hypothetical protein
MDITGYVMISDNTAAPNHVYMRRPSPRTLTFLPTAHNVPPSERTPSLSISPLMQGKWTTE